MSPPPRKKRPLQSKRSASVGLAQLLGVSPVAWNHWAAMVGKEVQRRMDARKSPTENAVEIYSAMSPAERRDFLAKIGVSR